MSLADLINRFLGIEKRVRRALPIRCVAPLIAIETKSGTIIRDTRQDVFVLDFDGWIVGGGPNGEADYTDGRYWVRRAVVTPDLAETDKLTFDLGPATADDNGDSNNDDVITVTNSPELPGNANESTAPSFTASHYLRIGQQVRVRAVYASDSSRHFVMNEPGPGGPLYLKLTAAWGSSTANMVVGNPCADASGTSPATNVLHLALFAPVTASGATNSITSTLASGDVIEYLPISPKQNQGTNTIDGICLPTLIKSASVDLGAAIYQVKQMTSSNTAAWQQIVLGV